MKKTMLLCTLVVIMLSCNNDDKKQTAISSKESKLERNKKVIITSMEAFAKRDIDGMLKDIGPGYTEYGDQTMPPVKNIDSTKTFIKMLINSIENYTAHDPVLVAEGDYVFYYANWTGTFKNDLMELKATNKPLKFTDCDIFKFNDDGKVTEHHSIQNMAALLMTGNNMK